MLSGVAVGSSVTWPFFCLILRPGWAAPIAEPDGPADPDL
jgi:hypothetical protein